MTTGIQTPVEQDEERAYLLREIARLQAELAHVRAETVRARAQLFAANRHTFTLTFAGGQVALLEVRGAADQEQARSLASTAIPTCHYTVTDGDTTDGQAQFLYYWCSVEAQKHAEHRQQNLVRASEREKAIKRRRFDWFSFIG